MTARLAAGIVLWLLGVLLVGALSAVLGADPNARAGGDWTDYRLASLRMIEGRSPYAAEMLDGPVAAQGTDRYRYPPLLAQLVTPLAVLPPAAGLALWSVLQVILLFVAVWVSATAAGAAVTVERFAWTGVAVTWFLPVFATIWTGNAEAPALLAVGALLAARGGTSVEGARASAAGLAAGAAGLLKLTVLTAIPALIRRRGRLAVGLVVALGALLVPSALSVPWAWADYVRVVPNLLAGEARYANNLAPAIVTLNLGAPALVSDLVRAAALTAAALLVAASVPLAAREDGWSAAVGCAVMAALLAPAALWYHYLALLLPLAAFAWPRSSGSLRGSLVASGAVVSLGLAFPPLAAVGGAWFSVAALAGLWPRTLAQPTAELGTRAWA